VCKGHSPTVECKGRVELELKESEHARGTHCLSSIEGGLSKKKQSNLARSTHILLSEEGELG
jgi:hypothetical protein